MDRNHTRHPLARSLSPLTLVRGVSICRTPFSNRLSLVGVYRDTSQVVFEKHSATGVAGITDMLQNKMPEGRHEVLTLDVAAVDATSQLVLVTGRILLAGESNPLNFSQMFYVSVLKNEASHTHTTQINYHPQTLVQPPAHCTSGCAAVRVKRKP